MVVPLELHPLRNNRPTSNGRLNTLLLIVWALVVTAVIVLFLGLITGGRWQGDEYLHISGYRDAGAVYWWNMFSGWTPRPVSVLLQYGYAQLVVTSGKPHITVALAGFWAVLIVTTTVGTCFFGPGKTRRGLVAGSVLALFLIYNPSGEMFYWPFGAVAYLPAIAGLAVFTLVSVQGPNNRRAGHFVASAGLLLAAGSTETGAVATLTITGALGAVAVARWQFQRVAPRLLWLIIPAAAAALVLWRVATTRMSGPPEAISKGTYHDVIGSLSAPLGNVRSLFGLPPNNSAGALDWPSVLIIVALAWVGLVFCFRESRTRPRPVPELLAVAAALLISAYLIFASLYFNYGLFCCPRHEAFRGCMMILMVVALAAAAAELNLSWLARLRLEVWGPALLSVAILFGLLRQSAALMAAYREVPRVIAIRSANWKEGQKPDRTMTFTITPPSVFFCCDDVPVRGQFMKASDNPWFIRGMLLFYNKDKIVIR